MTSNAVKKEAFTGARPNRVFKFVFSEMVRLQTEVNERRIGHWHFQDTFSAIQMPSGRRFTIGRQAERKLQELARNTIEKHDDLVGKFDTADLVAEFKVEIAKEIEAQTERSAADIVKECSDRLARSRSNSIRYYVPCLLPEHSLIVRFRLGPVQFHRKDRLWAELRDQFSEQEAGWFAKHIKDTEHYNWVASVDIKGFSDKKGWGRAYLLVELAIAAIKILYPANDAVWYGADSQLIPLRLRHRISQTEQKKASISWNKKFLSIKDDASIEAVLLGNRSGFIYLIGEFLKQHALRGKFGFISNKIVSALKWSDLANSHMLSSQRVISYSNCLEALFVTNESNKTAQIRDRSLYFLSVVDSERDWGSDVSSLYKARCDLVHGDISPIAEQTEKFVYLGKIITDKCIVGMLCFCVWLLKKYPIETTKRANSPFDGKANFTKAFLNDLPIFTEEIMNGTANAAKT
ncbi:HEPN domain-containing protein [Mesorhizobium sp. B2-3-4]|uniref:HEPN domain-containing protein n=1 Tax=Mesorhizobium sp. B2-3-4 TaxID=2589959 RepID=UPI00112BBAFE|nr:HEPN domain-containing protein [Mesorhizobium sp. B2-3-4]TPM35708.1 hypothetical protein FJ967_20140 [Mesorhizobium sp. B2-3-4]